MSQPKTAVVSAFCGPEWQAVADLTWPAAGSYASSCGARFCGEVFAADRIPRPHSWFKLVAIAKHLSAFDEVLWLDADVLALKGAPSIFSAVPPRFDHAAVRLVSPDGRPHLNMGVWLLRRSMLPWLLEAAMQDDLVADPWWEQAAINRIVAGPYPPTTCELDQKWNAWSGNKQLVPSPCFAHACGSADKLAELLKWLP